FTAQRTLIAGRHIQGSQYIPEVQTGRTDTDLNFSTTRITPGDWLVVERVEHATRARCQLVGTAWNRQTRIRDRLRARCPSDSSYMRLAVAPGNLRFTVFPKQAGHQ